MNANRFIGLFGLLLALSFFIPYQGWGQMIAHREMTQPKPGTHAPIITNAFAVDTGYNQYIWKIYIEGEDLDGEMLRIASVVEQAGGGGYPPNWIYLAPQYQKHFKGYIQWNIFGAPNLKEWTHITLRVSVFDLAGNESNEVIFPFTFQTRVKNPYNYRLPPPFDQENLPRLGYIDINLRDESPTGDVIFRTGF
jgi:hypothetical protein